MGSLWRSEKMTYVSLLISEDAAPTYIRELGNLGCIQFCDLNPDLTPFQRHYVHYVKRFDEIERKLRFLNNELKKMNIKPKQTNTINNFIKNSSNEDYNNSSNFILENLESTLEGYEQQFIDLNNYSDKLAEEYISKVIKLYLIYIYIYFNTLFFRLNFIIY